MRPAQDPGLIGRGSRLAVRPSRTQFRRGAESSRRRVARPGRLAGSLCPPESALAEGHPVGPGLALGPVEVPL